MLKFRGFAAAVSVLLITLVSIVSCKKDGPCEAVITVTDTLGRKISGATVILRQDSVISPVSGSPATVHEEQLTDGTGIARFSFPLECVLIAEAKKGTLDTRDFIRLEQSKSVAKTLVIR